MVTVFLGSSVVFSGYFSNAAICKKCEKAKADLKIDRLLEDHEGTRL